MDVDLSARPHIWHMFGEFFHRKIIPAIFKSIKFATLNQFCFIR